MRTLAEEAVSRVMQYLTAAGVQPTADVMRDAVMLVGEVLGRAGMVGQPDATAILAQIMEQVPQRFPLPEPLLPPASPPLRRGSIAYGSGT